MTRAPSRFSRVAPSTRSSAACTPRIMGMFTAMMPNTTAASAAMANTKISAHFTSMVKAMTIAPNTTKGERRNRRSVMFTPVCAWLTSLVRRVIIVETPISSMLEKDRLSRCSNSAWRTPVAKPVAALAEKYCAVMELTRPTAASAASTSAMRRMNGLSPMPMPRSMMAAITSGTSSSKDASSILNSGASTHSRR